MGASNILLEEKDLAYEEESIFHSNPTVPSNEGYGESHGNFSEYPSLSCDWADKVEDDDDDKFSSNESRNREERTLYWESQESLLQEILEHHSSTGVKLRQEIRVIIEMAKRDTNFCRCLNSKSSDNCYKCLRQRVVNLLCTKGFNATLCISQWNRTSKFPGGTHEFIEVIASTQLRKKQVSFLIELEFRDEFKMAKACKEYDNLVNQLPEIYIGKAEHLNSIVRLACDAAKKSTEERRIHMGPWRKRSFMQKKWSVSWRISPSSSPPPTELALASPISQVDVPQVGSYVQFSAGSAVKVA